jgi:hypothetical protein
MPPKLERTNRKTSSPQLQAEKETHPRSTTQQNAQNIITKNSYDILNHLLEEDDIQDPHKEKSQHKGKSHATHSATQSKEDHQGDKIGEQEDTLVQIDE